VNFDQLVLEGTIHEEDLALFGFASTPENAWDHLELHIAGDGAPCHAETI
jgi:hypothetical protein